MPAEAPFLFSIAGLSASLAGLAGLVATLRRGEGFRPIDRFRLQEIVEFAFANALISLTFVATATAIGETNAARIAGVGILAYLIGNGLGLFLRLSRSRLPRSERWLMAAGATSLAGGIVAVATAVTGAIPALEILLILLLARPMVAFLFVLASLDASDPG